MKVKNLVPVVLTSVLFIVGIGYAQRAGQPPNVSATEVILTAPAAPCDESLWTHVYAGTFGTAKASSK